MIVFIVQLLVYVPKANVCHETNRESHLSFNHAKLPRTEVSVPFVSRWIKDVIRLGVFQGKNIKGHLSRSASSMGAELPGIFSLWHS